MKFKLIPRRKWGLRGQRGPQKRLWKPDSDRVSVGFFWFVSTMNMFVHNLCSRVLNVALGLRGYDSFCRWSLVDSACLRVECASVWFSLIMLWIGVWNPKFLFPIVDKVATYTYIRGPSDLKRCEEDISLSLLSNTAVYISKNIILHNCRYTSIPFCKIDDCSITYMVPKTGWTFSRYCLRLERHIENSLICWVVAYSTN